MFEILNTINISLFEMQYIVLGDIILSTGKFSSVVNSRKLIGWLGPEDIFYESF